jgi:hypothetical protein
MTAAVAWAPPYVPDSSAAAAVSTGEGHSLVQPQHGACYEKVLRQGFSELSAEPPCAQCVAGRLGSVRPAAASAAVSTGEHHTLVQPPHQAYHEKAL